MTINGDWTLGAYLDLFGDKLGLCPLPPMTGGEDPKPYVGGNFFMVSSAVADDPALQAAVLDFIAYATSPEVQLAQLETLRRLPSNAEAINDPSLSEDPYLAASAAAVQKGGPADQPRDALRVRRHERRRPRQRCDRGRRSGHAGGGHAGRCRSRRRSRWRLRPSLGHR
jgi:ABC-type glycerol-3-phosphate transport system substrate-binding protein